jgi:thiamine kinase-like enzyme
MNQLKEWNKEHTHLNEIEICISMAERCIMLSKKSSLLQEHIKVVDENGILVHGDLHKNNFIKTESGKCFLIDFTLSRIDSPIKDIRFCFPEILSHSLYDKYFSGYPLGKQFEKLYYIDALFPHRIYARFSYFIRKNPLMPNLAYLKKIIDQEAEKEKMINKLL